jgi:L-asparaginase
MLFPPRRVYWFASLALLMYYAGWGRRDPVHRGKDTSTGHTDIGRDADKGRDADTDTTSATAVEEQRARACFHAGRANVTVFTTGGTIAAVSPRGGSDTTRYELGALNATQLLKEVDGLCEVANVAVVELANVGSHDIGDANLVAMARRLGRATADPLTQGVVLTHGTDTLEETAMWLDMWLRTAKPVVVTGAMRPASAMGADGPMNLFASVALAASGSARGRGVMVVMNDRILAARYVTKASSDKLDAFQAIEQGALGVFVNARPRFFFEAARPTGSVDFAAFAGIGAGIGIGIGIGREGSTAEEESEVDQLKLPRVDILVGYQGVGMDQFRSAVRDGARAVVLAGLGNGYWPSEAMQGIRELARQHKVMVLRSRRAASGFVEGRGRGGGHDDVDVGGDGTLGCGFLGPAQCRILVRMCLMYGMDEGGVDAVLRRMAGEEDDSTPR